MPTCLSANWPGGVPSDLGKGSAWSHTHSPIQSSRISRPPTGGAAGPARIAETPWGWVTLLGKSNPHRRQLPTRLRQTLSTRYVSRTILDPSGPGRILEVESVTRYCNKENIRRMTLQLCYFRSRGNILRFPLWTTAAHLCQLHHSLSSPTRRSTNFQTSADILSSSEPLSTSANYANPAS